MDEDSRMDDVLERDSRSGDDRRMPMERRNGRSRFLDRFVRTDRRRRARRTNEGTSRFSVLWRWAKG